MAITKEAVAARMNGREYGEELLKGEQEELKAARLVVLFGYSDDCVEVRGADHDELGTDDILLTGDGLLKNRCDEGAGCPYWQDIARNAEAKVEVRDGGEQYGLFEFRTEIPDSVFMIFEDGELYSSGIVFSLDDLRSTPSSTPTAACTCASITPSSAPVSQRNSAGAPIGIAGIRGFAW